MRSGWFGRRGIRTESLARELPPWITAPLLIAVGGALLWLEIRRPLRDRCEAKLPHDSRNLVLAAMSAAAIALTERPLTTPLTPFVQRRNVGLVKRWRVPPALEVVLAVVLLDYTLYLWHVMTHRIPFLWRFHRMHHADRDLETSTALRFHFAEMVLSVPWRCAQILLIGASPRSLSVWQTATLLAIFFHHSNVELPERVERWLCRILMTPRMHGIHHSIVSDETHSNWATIFSWPDYLHRSYRLNVPQASIEIGIAGHREVLSLPQLLAMPFKEAGPSSELGPTSEDQRTRRVGSLHELQP